MTDVLLTSENFVRTQTNISDNLQSKFLLSAIREAQDMDLQKVIGTELMTKLKTLVSSGEIELTENEAYKDLLDYAQYFLAYQTVTRLCVISTYKIDNIGVNTTSDENVNIPEMDDIFRLEAYYQNKTDFYLIRLQDYCVKNRTSLSELTDANYYEMQSHLSNAVSGGLHLTGKRGKRGLYGRYDNHIGYDRD